jgi:hypothetical protein
MIAAEACLSSSVTEFRMANLNPFWRREKRLLITAGLLGTLLGAVSAGQIYAIQPTVLDLTQPQTQSTADFLLLQGWSITPGKDGLLVFRGQGPESVASVSLPPMAMGKLTLELTLLPGGTTTAPLQVLLNDTLVGELTVQAGIPQTFQMALPVEAVHVGTNQLKFVYGEARPTSEGPNDFLFHAIRVEGYQFPDLPRLSSSLILNSIVVILLSGLLVPLWCVLLARVSSSLWQATPSQGRLLAMAGCGLGVAICAGLTILSWLYPHWPLVPAPLYPLICGGVSLATIYVADWHSFFAVRPETAEKGQRLSASLDLEFLLLIALVMVYFAWFAWPLVWTASENIRLVSVFSSDEELFLQRLKDAISQHTLKIELSTGIYYEGLYFNVALLPLFLLGCFTQVSEQRIIIVLRLVTIVFAIATIAAAFLLTRRYFGRLAAWLVALLLSILPLEFLHWSVTAHPDIPQVFFVVLGVYFCCRLAEEEHWRWLIWASASAGLAFASKYAGMFLLPVIWVVGVAQTIKKSSGLNEVILKTIHLCAAFGLAFSLASPFSFIGSTLLINLSLNLRDAAFGHIFKESGNGLIWFDVLLSPRLLDKFILGLAALSLVLTIYQVARGGWRRLLEPASVIWMWVIFYMGILILCMNMRAERFLLPIIPFLIILSIHPVSQVVEYAKSRLRRKYAAVLAIVILLIVGGFELPKSLSRVFEYRESTITREQTSTAVKAGQWLAENFSKSSRILYDSYSYVPPSFSDAHSIEGGTIQTLEALKPDVVVVNKAISKRYSDMSKATVYFGGESEFESRHEYYEALKEGKVGYVLVRDFGDIQVYARQDSLPSAGSSG